MATDPVLRRRGHASAVMRELLNCISDFDLAALCTSDDVQPFYERLGWERWHGPLCIRRDDDVIETPGEVVMVYRLPRTPSLDVEDRLSAEWRGGELW